MKSNQTLKAKYETRDQVEKALKKLVVIGYNINQLWIISTDLYLEDHVVNCDNSDLQIQNREIKYESKIRAGTYTLVITGNDKELEKARQILKLHIPKE
ncbi:hypothetical protein [Flavobacterium sp.]|uniref:hypothetical protein n=1 Tax=Flavobacterium sp. TaxID=239 RepID=UPI003D6B7478